MKEMGRNRSTLFYWLKYYRDKTDKRLDTIETRRRGAKPTKMNNLKRATEQANRIWDAYDNDLTFLIGLALYWAEGAKSHANFTNSDVEMIKFICFWAARYFGDVGFTISVYANEQNREFARAFWEANLDMSNFKKIKVYDSVTAVRKPSGIAKIEMSGFKLFKLTMAILLDRY